MTARCRCGHEPHIGRCTGCVACLERRNGRGANGHPYRQCTCVEGMK